MSYCKRKRTLRERVACRRHTKRSVAFAQRVPLALSIKGVLRFALRYTQNDSFSLKCVSPVSVPRDKFRVCKSNSEVYRWSDRPLKLTIHIPKGNFLLYPSNGEVYRWSDRPVILTTRVPNHNYQLHKSNGKAIKVKRSPSKSHNWCSNGQVSS